MVPEASISTADWRVDPVEIPSSRPAGEPLLTRAPDGTVYASWVERLSAPDEKPRRHRLVFSVFDAVNDVWSDPHVISSGAEWFVNWADVPSLTVGQDGHMIAHWLEANGHGRYAYGVRVSLSGDAGARWTDPIWLHDDDSATEHGFAAFAPVEGGFEGIWLDGRKFADDNKEMTLRSRTVFWDGTRSAEHVLDERTCDCCPNTILATETGALVAAYRNRSMDEVRDIHTVRHEHGEWSEPRLLSGDSWQINACPVNGPALASQGEAVAIAWYTMGGGVTGRAGAPQIRMAFSLDDGVSFGSGTMISDGEPVGRVSLTMVSPARAVVSWIEKGLWMREVGADGSVSSRFKIADIAASRAAGYPRIMRLTDGRIVSVWTRALDHDIASAVVSGPGREHSM